jgi:hypothetical protein
LWRSFQDPKQKNKLNLQRHKKLSERILRGLLVLCKVGLLSFVAQLVSGTRKVSLTSWKLVWFSTTWSLRMRETWTWNFFLQYWKPSEAGKEPRSRPSISWNISANWRLDHAHSAEPWSYRAPLAASRGKTMPQLFIHLISYC